MKKSGGTRSAVGEREEAEKKRKNIHAGIEVNQYLYKGPDINVWISEWTYQNN